MEAQANTHKPTVEIGTVMDRRTVLRYRFAHLLTQGHFEEAMAGALAAHARKEILDPDLQFVIEIVRAAEQMKARQQRTAVNAVAPVSSPLTIAPVSGTA